MFDHEQTDSATIHTFGLPVAPVTGDFMRRLQRLGKRSGGLSARGVADCFGVKRATFKAWQTGKKSITQDNQHRARSLYREWLHDVRADAVKERGVGAIDLEFARGFDGRMRTLKISRKPKKCRVCGCWFEPHSGRQVRCSDCANKPKRRKKK